MPQSIENKGFNNRTAPAATHKGGDEFDIEKESCVDYEKLIETIIKEKML